MSRYRWRDRLIEVENGKVERIHGPGTGRRELAKLPKRLRLQVRGQVEVLSGLRSTVASSPTKEDDHASHTTDAP